MHDDISNTALSKGYSLTIAKDDGQRYVDVVESKILKHFATLQCNKIKNIQVKKTTHKKRKNKNQDSGPWFHTQK